MKMLMMMLLVSMSSVVMANEDYSPMSAEQWRDSAGGNSFSDSRYRAQYSPTQRQSFIDQRNADIAKRSNTEMAKRSSHANEMQQYYTSERASKQFIDESIGYNNQPIGIQPQSQGQYYPYSGNNNYYGNGSVQMRFTPAQTQGFINQNNNDRARQEQADANYEKWRQYQNGRREYERFIGD